MARFVLSAVLVVAVVKSQFLEMDMVNDLDKFFPCLMGSITFLFLSFVFFFLVSRLLGWPVMEPWNHQDLCCPHKIGQE